MMRDFKPEAYVSVINRFFLFQENPSHLIQREGVEAEVRGDIEDSEETTIKSNTQPPETLTIWQLKEMSIKGCSKTSTY